MQKQIVKTISKAVLKWPSYNTKKNNFIYINTHTQIHTQLFFKSPLTFCLDVSKAFLWHSSSHMRFMNAKNLTDTISSDRNHELNSLHCWHTVNAKSVSGAPIMHLHHLLSRSRNTSSSRSQFIVIVKVFFVDAKFQFVQFERYKVDGSSICLAPSTKHSKGQKMEKLHRGEERPWKREERERSKYGGTQQNSRKKGKRRERETWFPRRRTGETLRLGVMQQAVAMVMWRRGRRQAERW